MSGSSAKDRRYGITNELLAAVRGHTRTMRFLLERTRAEESLRDEDCKDREPLRLMTDGLQDSMAILTACTDGVEGWDRDM